MPTAAIAALKDDLKSNAISVGISVTGAVVTAALLVIWGAVKGMAAPALVGLGIGVTAAMLVGISALVYLSRSGWLRSKPARTAGAILLLAIGYVAVNRFSEFLEDIETLRANANKAPVVERIIERVDPNPELQKAIGELQGTVTKQEVELQSLRRDLGAANSEGTRLRQALDDRAHRRAVSDKLAGFSERASGLYRRCGVISPADFLQQASAVRDELRAYLRAEGLTSDAQRVDSMALPLGLPRLVALNCDPFNENRPPGDGLRLIEFILQDIVARLLKP